MKTYLALDIGEKRIGAAVGSVVAFGRGTIVVSSKEQAEKAIEELIEKDRIDEIVVGLPLVKSGETTPSQALARSWASRVKEISGLPVHFVDESYTSVEAERQLREEGIDTATNKDRIDERSAMILLEQFLQT